MKLLWRLFFVVMRRYVDTALWFFFRKWQVHGEENIPENACVIYVANHQNAFQDALLASCSTWDEPWFLTRGGVFKGRIARAIFHSFHMLPVYRFRDGVKGLRSNDVTFRQCVDLLKRRKSILVFGEGDQSMRYQLRSLQRGFARIALTVQQESNWNAPLFVVPVGIQYDHYYNFRSRVLMNYGKAIPIDTSYQSFPEREFYDVLIDRVRRAIMPLMIHIENADHDRIVTYLRQHRNKKDLVEQLEEDQRVVKSWEEIPKTDFRIPAVNSISIVLAFPLHMYVWVNNIIPYLLIHWLLNNYVTLEFRGSLKLGFGMVIVPLFYLIQSMVIQTIFSDWRITLVYLLTLPFLSIWSVDLYKKAMRKE